MNLSVMQPYLFPYIGYFQLMYASDLFLIYDDVSYIKQGFINRNSILMAGKPLRFTVPVPGASSNRLISELSYSRDVIKLLKTISQAYSKSPYFSEVFPLVRQTLELGERRVSDVCLESYRLIFSYLGLDKRILKTGDLEYQRELRPEDRIISLCKKFGANRYINPVGGSHLYSRERFKSKEVDIYFLRPIFDEYDQGGEGFFSGLSIIDCLMNCSPSQVRSMLCRYELV